MVYDLTMLKAFYALYEGKIERIRTLLQRPLTLAEKILYAHLYDEKTVRNYKRGEDYVNFRPDRVAMQDATAQMALLQFMNAGPPRPRRFLGEVQACLPTRVSVPLPWCRWCGFL